MNASSKRPAPTINQWLARAAQKLDESGIPSARLDAEILLAHALHHDRTWLITHSDDIVEKPEQADALIHHRLRHIPIAYLTGHKEFYGREFIVTPDVLIPRPESEMFIHILRELSLPKSPAIHDVGTGSGSLAITIALELPGSSVSGSDISESALKIARENAAHLGAKTVSFHAGNLLEDFSGSCDAIVANLPYVDTSWKRSPETNHEPALALFADDGGMELIKKLIVQAENILKPGGYLLLEADPEQHSPIIEFGRKHHFTHLRTDDYIVTLQR